MLFSIREIFLFALLFFFTCICYLFSEKVVTEDIPADMEAFVADKRRELIEAVSEVDEKLAESFLGDEPISNNDLEVCRR